jgi:hypothetical protein
MKFSDVEWLYTEHHRTYRLPGSGIAFTLINDPKNPPFWQLLYQGRHYPLSAGAGPRERIAQAIGIITSLSTHAPLRTTPRQDPQTETGTPS